MVIILKPEDLEALANDIVITDDRKARAANLSLLQCWPAKLSISFLFTISNGPANPKADGHQSIFLTLAIQSAAG